MKRVLAGVVLVALAGVAIWLGTRRSGDDPAPARTPDPAPQPVERPQTVKITPQLPDQPRLAGDDAGVSQYTIDGIPVRDHRTHAGTQQPFDQSLHEPNTRQIPATLTADVSRKVNAVMRECGHLLPADARGPKPRVEGDLIVSIKGGVLTVDKSMLQLRDVVGDPGPMQQCVEQKTVGLSTAASDQADLTNYSIHVSFVVLATPPPPGP